MPERANAQKPATAEANVYAGVYHVLLVGMFVSTSLFAAGVIRALILHAHFPLTTEWVRDHARFMTVIHGLARLDPTALMVVASVLLILTPVVRVVVSIYAFWMDHDYRYVLVTGLVLAIMVLTFVLSRVGLQ
jgi:uncharacterized membrane protein